MLADIKLNTKLINIPNGTTLIVVPMTEKIPIPGNVTSISSNSLTLIRIMEDAHISESEVVLLYKKNKNLKDNDIEAYSTFGVIGRIVQIVKVPDIGFKAIIHPLQRTLVEKFAVSNDTVFAQVSPINVNFEFTDEGFATSRIVKRLFTEYKNLKGGKSSDIIHFFPNYNNKLSLADNIIAELEISLDRKQELLKINDINKIFKELYPIIIQEINFLKLEKKVEAEVSHKVMEEQKQYFMKEKLNNLRKEVTGDQSDIVEVDQVNDLIESGVLNEDAKEKINGEIEKLHRLHSMSPEYGLIRDYLSLVVKLPWKDQNIKDIDVNLAEKILDEDHYGLNEPKDRILEYISILKLSQAIKGPILCLVGPPGVGKTSLGRSIARALDRKYIRVALGGIQDEAEIRGHRRTYIGAMPGKVIKSLQKAKVKNPLFLLDEIDKLTSNMRGDPASALLEVLDPEQNHTFVDNYLDMEFDLSKIIFIATANDKHKIPQPLLDRMELIELEGYTDIEKFHIAKDYLIDKQKELNGLKGYDLKIQDSTIYKIISDYTKEAGVRDLERKIAEICRKSAKLCIEGKQNIMVTTDNLEEFLGTAKFLDTRTEKKYAVGEVKGLAWTIYGGSVLKTETNIYSGKGNIILTGKLGDIMKESASVALSYIRTISSKVGLNNDIFKTIDIHLHFPMGAIPKDGPSAGITMIISMLSSLLDKKVSQKIGMTGEVSIHGDIYPIGGLKAKLMAAKREGITTVYIPEGNMKDLKNISEDIKQDLNIIPAKIAQTVIENILGITFGK